MPWTRWTDWIRRRSDDDFAAEIESHLAMEVERLVHGGMSEAEARFAARRAFGNTTARREHFHASQRWSGVESVVQDVRHGLRAMRRAPQFTAIAVASLAIGIGANTTNRHRARSGTLRPRAVVRSFTSRPARVRVVR